MSEDLTNRLPADGQMLSRILDTLIDLNIRLQGTEQKLDTLLTMQADCRDLYERVRLELKP
jgi:hypothetical protein